MGANLTTRLGQLTSSPAGGPYTGANKIINGDMVISQIAVGAAVPAVSGVSSYPVDRFISQVNVSSKITSQQAAAGGATGLAKCLGYTSLSAYSVAAGEYFLCSQKVEGYNVADLLWGTASAKTITVSFWVYSSLTGLHGGVVSNSAQDRTYPYSYTISVANTWEYKTVTIAGDTSGTWLTTNGIGLHLRFSLGTGATYKGTAGAWTAGTYFSCTGEVSTVGTNGATWYVTGVKLEVGTIATPFVSDDYAVSLEKCQRYYEKTYSQPTAPGGITSVGSRLLLFYNLSAAATGVCSIPGTNFATPKRAVPTTTVYSPQTGATGKAADGITGTDTAAGTSLYAGETSFLFYAQPNTSTTTVNMTIHWTADAEL